MNEQSETRRIVSWIIQMTPEASIEKIYKVASESPELVNVDKETVLDAIKAVLRDRGKTIEEGAGDMKKNKEKKKEGISERKDYLYGRYRIVSGLKDDQYLANAYTANGSSLIISLSGDDPDAVTQRVKQHIDDHLEKFQKSRDDQGVPCSLGSRLNLTRSRLQPSGILR